MYMMYVCFRLSTICVSAFLRWNSKPGRVLSKIRGTYDFKRDNSVNDRGILGSIFAEVVVTPK